MSMPFLRYREADHLPAFDRYKNDLGLDRTRVQGDFSVIGSEFVNFIATIMTCRMLKKATDAKLLEDRTWGNLLEDLSEVWRDTDALDNPKTVMK